MKEEKFIQWAVLSHFEDGSGYNFEGYYTWIKAFLRAFNLWLHKKSNGIGKIQIEDLRF
jgi:hypothetical protein